MRKKKDSDLVKSIQIHIDEVKAIDPEELRARREALGMSTTKLAALIGASPSWIAAVERGEKTLLRAPYIRVRAYLKSLGLEA